MYIYVAIIIPLYSLYVHSHQEFNFSLLIINVRTAILTHFWFGLLLSQVLCYQLKSFCSFLCCASFVSQAQRNMFFNKQPESLWLLLRWIHTRKLGRWGVLLWEPAAPRAVIRDTSCSSFPSGAANSLFARPWEQEQDVQGTGCINTWEGKRNIQSNNGVDMQWTWSSLVQCFSKVLSEACLVESLLLPEYKHTRWFLNIH